MFSRQLQVDIGASSLYSRNYTVHVNPLVQSSLLSAPSVFLAIILIPDKFCFFLEPRINHRPCLVSVAVTFPEEPFCKNFGAVLKTSYAGMYGNFRIFEVSLCGGAHNTYEYPLRYVLHLFP